jgi:hypothetical protein
MESANEVIALARDAERRLWQHFGLTPLERYVEVVGMSLWLAPAEFQSR